MSCNATLDLCRKRGDTFADVFQVKINGVAVNVTGDTFLLTVDPEPEPATAANNLFQLVGILVTPASGIISFAPSALQADQTPDTYFYDIEWTRTGSGAGEVITILSGAYAFNQDITK